MHVHSKNNHIIIQDVSLFLNLVFGGMRLIIFSKKTFDKTFSVRQNAVAFLHL
jgi:hypothetical protein